MRRPLEWLLFVSMSIHTIHIQSEVPDLLIEFDLPPGTHARIGASPQAELHLPLGGIPPFSCILGSFQDGRLYLAELDGTIWRRVDLPAVLTIAPYEFNVFHPEEYVEEASPAPSPVTGKPPRTSSLSQKLKSVLERFTSAGPPPVPPE